ncbi:MAG: hypothetical protein L0170_20160, partial [Acidobacteria bacterium]|nr:hypothetical protein [Acidobacteriota bacterium]
PGNYIQGKLPSPSAGGGGSGSSGGGGRGRAPKQTPEEQVLTSIYKSALKKSLTDPWVVIKNGKVKFSTALNAPKGSLGIRRSDFFKTWEDLNDTFQAFISRKAKAGEVALILKKGWSGFTVANMLSKKPAFLKSRIFKAAAPGFNGVAFDILGDAWSGVNLKARQELIRKAIVGDWSQATFAEKLRQMPAYLKGVEFQGNVASLRSVYEDIYGVATPGSMTRIQEAALARWSPVQFQAHLRGLPGYTSSPEFQTRALSVLDALGMITGQLPALRPGAAPPNPAAPGPPAPNSPRIPGAPGPVAGGPTAAMAPGFA